MPSISTTPAKNPIDMAIQEVPATSVGTNSVATAAKMMPAARCCTAERTLGPGRQASPLAAPISIAAAGTPMAMAA